MLDRTPREEFDESYQCQIPAFFQKKSFFCTKCGFWSLQILVCSETSIISLRTACCKFTNTRSPRVTSVLFSPTCELKELRLFHPDSLHEEFMCDATLMRSSYRIMRNVNGQSHQQLSTSCCKWDAHIQPGFNALRELSDWY